MGNNIYDTIMAFYSRISCDPNHRYRSWEHCYKHFQKLKNNQNPSGVDYDLAALHLAFYLASWGMYRGSSRLLWKDYKIHIPAVKYLLNSNYDQLWDLSQKQNLLTVCIDDVPNNNIIPLIINLSYKLSEIYSQELKKINCEEIVYKPSNTLITKILLGTIACTPACDRYFILGWRGLDDLTYSHFDEKFLCQVFEFYLKNKQQFDQAQQKILKQSGILYPIMKLIDMYFWELAPKKINSKNARGGKSMEED